MSTFRRHPLRLALALLLLLALHPVAPAGATAPPAAPTDNRR